MVASTIPKILAQLEAHEGKLGGSGYVNDPRDPGGETNCGVTHATYDAYRKARGLPKQSVKYMSRAEWQDIIHDQFWRPMGCDDLPPGVDYSVFDSGWGSGPSRGVKWLQAAVGVPQDGKVGPQTLAAVQKVADKAALAGKVQDIRLGFMRSLKIWPIYGKGWARRCADVKALSAQLARGQAPAPAKPSPVQPAPVIVGAGGGVVAGAVGAPWWAFVIIFVVVVGFTVGWLVWKNRARLIPGKAVEQAGDLHL